MIFQNVNKNLSFYLKCKQTADMGHMPIFRSKISKHLMMNACFVTKGQLAHSTLKIKAPRHSMAPTTTVGETYVWSINTQKKLAQDSLQEIYEKGHVKSEPQDPLI